jgi:hypothetical protein
MPNQKSQGNEPIFDRSRISHKESKRASVLGIQVQRAQRDLDAETVEKILEELDNLVCKTIVYIPHNWFIDGSEVIDFSQPGSLDAMKADKYEELMKAAQPQPGEKKD